MSKKNISILNIKSHKDWISSWYIRKNEYFFVLQEDIILYLYIRSKIHYFLKNSIMNIKLVRIMNLLVIIFINETVRKNLIQLKKNNFFKKIIFLRKNIFFNFFLHTSQFLKKDLFLSTYEIFTSYNVFNSSTVALRIARLIEKRVRFRSKLIRRLIKNVHRKYHGIYIECKGRINNVDMARNDFMCLGSVPFQSFDLSIDYSLAIANTVKGLQSIKVWVYK